MQLFLEKTTGRLVPGGSTPAWPRAATAVDLAFLNNGLAELVAGGSVALKLYAPDDLITPVATFSSWTEDATAVSYGAAIDLSALALPAYVARIEYGAGPTISQAFHVRVGAAQAAPSAPSPITIIINQSGGGGAAQAGSLALGSNVKAGTVAFSPALAAAPSRVEASVEPPGGTGAVISVAVHSRTAAGFSFLLSGRTPDAAHVLRWAAYA